jgi:hypothetical protein
MNAFVARLGRRLPRTLFGRLGLLLMVALTFWAAYRFGHTYGLCRGESEAKVGCVMGSAIATPALLYLEGFDWLSRAAAAILP